MLSSKLEKLFFKEFQDLFPADVIRLYNNSQYDQVCFELSKNYTSSTLPFQSRILIGLAMIKRGSIRFGLHQLSIAYEISLHLPNTLSRLFLGLGYQLAGLYQVASFVLADVPLSNIQSLTWSGTKFDPQDTEFERDAGMNCLQKYRDDVIKLSLGYRVYEVHNCTKEVCSHLLENIGRIVKDGKIVDSEKSVYKEGRYIKNHSKVDKIFSSIIMLVPVLGLYNELLNQEESLILFLENCSKEIFEIIIYNDAATTVGGILYHSPCLDRFMDILKIKLIHTFLEYLRCDYQSAFEGFEWILDVYFELLNTGSISPNHPKFPEESMRCIALLCANAYLKCPDSIVTVYGLDKRTKYFLDTSSCFIEHQERPKGKLDCYFLTTGLIYQKKAILLSSEVSLEKIQINKDNLEEMIRKYILVTNLLPSDDDTLTSVYDEILTAFLLYGGLHIKVMWVFKFLRDYFTLEMHLHSCPFTGDYFSVISEFNELTENSKYLLNHISNAERLFSDHLLIDDDSSTSMLIPKFDIIAKENKLISIEAASEDFQDNITKSQIDDQINKSHEFIYLWIKSYEDYNDQLPIEVYNFLKRLKLVK